MPCICGFKASPYLVENTRAFPETETKGERKKEQEKKTKNEFFF